MGVAGAVVGVSGGAVVAGVTAGGDVVAGVGWVPAAWLGVAAAFGGVLADVEHVGLGDGLVAATLPFEPVPLPWPPGIRWPVPLLLAPPPAPVADLPPDEEEPMVTIACRTPGTAMAVPANRKTAAKASTGLSHAVPNRS